MNWLRRVCWFQTFVGLFVLAFWGICLTHQTPVLKQKPVIILQIETGPDPLMQALRQSFSLPSILEERAHLLDDRPSQPVTDPEVLAMVERLKKWGGINESIGVVTISQLSHQADIHRAYCGGVVIRIEEKHVRDLPRNYLQAWLAHEIGHLYCGHVDSVFWNEDEMQAEADAFEIKMVGIELYKEELRTTLPVSKEEVEARIQRAIAIGEPPRRMGHTNTYARIRPR